VKGPQIFVACAVIVAVWVCVYFAFVWYERRRKRPATKIGAKVVGQTSRVAGRIGVGERK